MSNHAKAILDLLKTRPDLRPVQVADLLDMDLEVAQNTLVALSKENKVITKSVIAPNKMPATAYSLPATTLNWSAPKMDTTAAEPTVTAVTTTEPEQTKVQKAVACLKVHDRVAAKDLCDAMGVDHRYSPTQFLANQIKSGVIIKDGQWYRIARPQSDTQAALKTNDALTVKPVEKAKSEATEFPPTTQNFPCAFIQVQPHSAKTGVISILKENLTNDEYMGYLKGNVIERTLRGDSRGAYEYAGRLAEAQV